MATEAINGYYISEVASFLATAPVASDTWIRVPHLGTETLGKTLEFDMAQEADNLGMRSRRYKTVKSGGFTIKTRVHTGSLSDDNGSGGPAQCFAQKLLENYFGAVALHTTLGTTVAAPGTATGAAGSPIVVTAATGMAVNNALMVGAAGGSAADVRFITVVSGSNITLDAALAAANRATSSVIYGGFTFIPTLGEYSKYLYLTHVMDGHVDMIGPCRVTGFKITNLAAKMGMQYEFTLTADSFYYGTGVTPSAIPAQAFTGTPIVSVGGSIAVGGTERACHTASVEFPCKFEEISTNSTAGATNGRAGYTCVSIDGGGIELESLYAAASQDVTDWQADTVRAVRLSHHTGSTNVAQACGAIAVRIAAGEIDAADGVNNRQRGIKTKITPVRPTDAEVTAGVVVPMSFCVFGGEL